ncbi:dihydrofolate reductase family protein [Dyadobacter pollutisoli]|jgi:dihydrofolate reductase|uniref:Dihydrofolate reductase family protein n=1 Tax=Dyadobacter pollutisoli TaxID=2910158 RepID=A0A9E8SP99_9BACT|nr:dihydrofolate reductase family protein [Dyadobacter pollutisoli]WAC14506.1 dihydrofolate reductase family protein [Dyadobacter pollutisoli]
MQKVIMDITMSLDGYTAGPQVSLETPLGIGGERLHDWLFKDKTPADEKLVNDLLSSSGSVITGGRTYATAIPEAWGGTSPFKVPTFVLINEVPEVAVDGFTYITTGPEDALNAAKKAADGKNVWIMGGAGTIQQYLKKGLADELHIHIAHVLLNGGTRLFETISKEQTELEKYSLTESPGVTHIYFRVLK